MSDKEQAMAEHLRHMLNEVEAFLDNLSGDYPAHKLSQHSPEFLTDYIQAAKFMEQFHGRKNHRIKGAEELIELLCQ